MVLDGAAELTREATGYRRPFRQGETVLLPATAAGLRWTPTPGPVTLFTLLP